MPIKPEQAALLRTMVQALGRAREARGESRAVSLPMQPVHPGRDQAVQRAAIELELALQGMTQDRLGVGKDDDAWVVYGADVPGSPGVPEVLCEHDDWNAAMRCACWRAEHGAGDTAVTSARKDADAADPEALRPDTFSGRAGWRVARDFLNAHRLRQREIVRILGIEYEDDADIPQADYAPTVIERIADHGLVHQLRDVITSMRQAHEPTALAADTEEGHRA